MTLSGYWLTLALLAPLLMALILMVWPTMRRSAFVIAPWSALPALCIALVSMDFSTIKLPGLLLGTQIGLDETGRYFLLLTTLVWLVAGLHARQTFARPKNPGFFILFLLAMVGNLGTIIAGGILSFYFSFALMSFSAYGLVIHTGSKEALRAGRIYMVFLVLGEVMLLSALMLAASQAQGYDFETIRATVAQSDYCNTILLLFVMGLGIKIGLPGLHFTLPLIYRAAPIPAAAALAGAMINAGLLGWLRLLPAGPIALPEWSVALMVLGLFAAFYGVLVGLTQRDPKTLLAYSSISQMGMMTLAVGLGLATPQAWPQILMVITIYAVHHGLAKASLFLGIEVAQHRPHSRYWHGLLGLGLLLPALALAGAPLTSGMLAKALLKEHIDLAPWPEVLNWLLPLSSLATTLLVLRFVYLAWPRTNEEHRQICPWKLSSWALLVVASLLLVWFFPQATVAEQLSLSMLWQSLWPVLTAVAIAFIAVKMLMWKKITVVEIPAGDLFVPIQFAVQQLTHVLIHITVEKLPHWQKQLTKFIAKLANRINRYNGFASVEARLRLWPVAMILFLVLLLVLILPNLLITASASQL